MFGKGVYFAGMSQTCYRVICVMVFFKIGCFDRCWESLLYLLALTNMKTVMTTRQNFEIYRKTAKF